MIKLTIDDTDVQIEEGLTILDAAQRAGKEIPTLCHDERLAAFGACRICLVEVEGSRTKFTPSCTTPATDGMKVKTMSTEIKKARQAILELLLVNHPLDCPVCDKAGECKLQDLVYEYGVSKSRYHGQIINLPIDRISPLIERNLNRCILCGKCVRVCDEVIGVSETSFVNRGMQAKIGTDFDRPLNCEFCGQCIDICPVGALTSRLFKYKARLWELNKITTICSFCSTGCSVTFGLKDRQILEAYNEKDTGVNGRHLCVKGRFGWDYVHHPQRLTSPLIKRDGELVEASWEEALTEVAERLSYLKETYGSQSLAGLASERLTNEELYLFQKFMRLTLGTNNLSTLSKKETSAILKRSLGFAASPNSMSEISKTNLILVLSDNLPATNPILSIKVTQEVKQKGLSLITISSRRTRLDRLAAYTLHLMPGRKIALINGLINLISQSELFNRKFVTSQTEGSKALRNSVLAYTAEYVEKLTGISRAVLEAIAKAYSQAENALIIMDGSDAGLSQAVVNLALLTGHIGREGSGIIITGEKCNSQGAIDMGVSHQWLPGCQDVNDAKVRKRFEEMWAKELPTEGLSLNEILSSAEQGKVKALYIIGQDIISASPNPNQTEQALKSLDLLIVQDLFLTETAKLADVVLPAVSFAQKEGSFTNLERRVQRLNRVVRPAFGQPDWQIIQNLSNRLGMKMEYRSSEEIMAEIDRVVPYYSSRIEGGQWSDSEASFLYRDGFPRSKAVFYPTEYEPIAEDKDYPFELITGSVIFHSGTMSRYSQSLMSVYEEVMAEINPHDAMVIGISHDSLIKVSSVEASIEVKVKINPKILCGTIFIPRHPKGLVFKLSKSDFEWPVKVRIESCPSP